MHLLGAIEDAPKEVEYCQNDIRVLEYFIERSEQVKLDLKDRDSLLRFVGDLEFLLTEAECRQMLENEAIWRPYPVSWLGARPGQIYAAALHPKEVAYLREMQREQKANTQAIEAGAKDCESELAQLRAIGPLPPDIADKYVLTPEGTWQISSEPKSK